MIEPTSFAIHVTYRCPLTCAHCCFSSGPGVSDAIPFEQIVDTVRALDDSSIRLIAFTGGEPFLLGSRLADVVREAHQRGFITRVVTSAFWARSRAVADTRMDALGHAGLDQLSISWDDFHEEQRSANVTFDCVFNAFWAARERGILPAVNIVQAADSRWTATLVRERLGLPPDAKEVVIESPLNKTGRAAIDLEERGVRPVHYLGPCPYVVTGPTLSAKNKLLACCGVIENTNALVIDEPSTPATLNAAIRASQRSPLLNWLHLRGPYHVMRWIADRHGIAIPPPEAVGGNCEACRLLFTTPEIAQHIPAALDAQAEALGGEVEILSTLGFLNAPEGAGVLYLWNEGCGMNDTAAFATE